MSQMDLAKKAGVASITISRLERGIQKPSLQTIRKLADALEVEVADIVFRLKLQKPPLPKEEAEEPVIKLEIEEEQVAPAQVGEIKPEAKVEELAKPEPEAMEGATGYEGGAVGDLRENIADEVAADSGSFLGSKAADELEAGRATLAAATILPLSLLRTGKTWVWIAVLVGIAIIGYFLLRPYFRRGESTSPPKEPVKHSGGDSVEDFLNNY